jgi:peptidoglycan L-alanyl-D-glutamate endopeptidase CwlK
MGEKPYFPEWDQVHPRVRGLFMGLSEDLHKGYSLGVIPVWFRPFEIYRTPTRQAELLRTGKTKAGPWSSAHQYGLAIDFVPYVRGSWSWAVSDATWDHLRAAAKARGLRNEITWDRAHVEAPIWDQLQTLLRPQISGSVA